MKYLFSLALTVLCTISLMAQNEVSKAKDAIARGSYDEAITLLQTYLANNAKDVEANYYLGETYRLKGNIDKAQEQLEKTLDYDDEYDPAIASIIRVYGKKGLWDKAEKQYQYSVKYHKNGLLAPLAFANAYLEADSLDKAAIYFSKLKSIDPKNVDAYIGLAEVYSRQNVIILAEMNLKTATELDPNNPALWYKLATTIMKNRSLNANQIREVTEDLKKSIELDSTNTNAIFDAGNIFYRIGQRPEYYREAAGFFQKYVQLKKDNPEAWEKYGISAFKANAFNDAIPALERAIAMEPKNYELKPMLANSYYYTQEYQKSIDAFNKFPKDSLAKDDYYKMGVGSFRLNDTSNAIKYFELANDADTAGVIASGDLAAIYVGQHNYPKALDEYNRFLKKEPDNLTALFYAGYSAYVLEKYDLAKGYFEKFVALRPSTIPGRNLLGQVYIQLDMMDPARDQFNTIISLADSSLKAEPAKAAAHNSEIVSAYRSLALIEYKGKNFRSYDSAIDYLEKATMYEPKNKPDESLHLFLAQMYAISIGNKEILADKARELKKKSCDEYKIVLKVNPRNATAKKELASLNCD